MDVTCTEIDAIIDILNRHDSNTTERAYKELWAILDQRNEAKTQLTTVTEERDQARDELTQAYRLGGGHG